MLKKISKINHFGVFDDFTQEKDFTHGDNNCNIIFGFNGSGKSTIANIFSLFSNESFLEKTEKENIFNDYKNNDLTCVELELSNGTNLKYPSNNNNNKEIYIFDKTFICSHVFIGEVGKIKKFSNTTVGAEIKNEAISRISEKIKLSEEKINLKEKENNSLYEKYQKINKEMSARFGNSLTDKGKNIKIRKLEDVDLPDESFETLNSDLEKFKIEYELSKKQDQLKSDIATLEQAKPEGQLKINVSSISENLQIELSQLSKDILNKKINEIKDYFDDDLKKKSVERWFKFGRDILLNIKKESEPICPVCDSEISDKIDDLFKNYEDYFNESYDNIFNKISDEIQLVSEAMKNVIDSQLFFQQLKIQHEKYKVYFKDMVLNDFDFDLLNLSLSSLKDALEIKKQNIQYTHVLPESLNKEISDYSDFISLVVEQKNIILKTLNSKNLDTHEVEENIREVFKKIILVDFNSWHNDGAIKKYKNNSAIIKNIQESVLPKLKSELSTELKKIKIESKAISKYLKKLGIDHFDIEINEKNDNENIIIKYKKSGKEKNKLKNSLSDAEKTALAFSYFLSKFEYEVNTEQKIKDSCVVIDDPISSLDENRLYSTALLIHKNFKKSKQLIVLSHNFLFLKYFNSFFKNKAVFFLNKCKLENLPEEMKNFETPYFYMMKILHDFLSEDVAICNYKEARKYLPNYLRRVLETFICFKFCYLSSKDKKNQSIGLNEFTNNEIDGMELHNEHIGDINKENISDKLREIVKVSDSYSHGNSQHTQESHYISESELRRIIKNGLDIIQFFDVNHKFK